MSDMREQGAPDGSGFELSARGSCAAERASRLREAGLATSLRSMDMFVLCCAHPDPTGTVR